MERDEKRLFLEDLTAWDALPLDTEATPFYLFHENMAVENVLALRRHFGDGVRISYAMKANPWLAKAAGGAADFVEVSSPGELALCRAYGIPGAKLTVDGLLWPAASLRAALEMGVTRFCVDSAQQLSLLLGEARGKPLSLLLRLSAGDQFGMDRRELAACLRRTGGRVHGLQFYPGTQRTQPGWVRRDLRCLKAWLTELDGLGWREVEFGAGLGLPCFAGEQAQPYLALLEEVSRFARELGKRCQVTYEAGRLIAASCGVYVTRVFARRRREARTYLFCQGGTGHLRYQGGELGVRTPKLRGLCAHPSRRPGVFTLCGPLCAQADILARTCSTLDAAFGEGDRIVFYGAGAYAAETGNLLMAIDLPRILIYNGGEGRSALRCARGALSAGRLLDDRMCLDGCCTAPCPGACDQPVPGQSRFPAGAGDHDGDFDPG